MLRPAHSAQPTSWPAWVGRALLLAASLVGVVSLARSQDADAREERSAERDEPHLNLTSPTLGGKQFWTDELVFHDWRVQRNVLTNHCRLLDENDLRRGWGSFEQCRDQLESLKRQLPLRPMRRHAVLVLHGLGRTRQSMEKMCTYLQEHTEDTILNVSYASTREPLHQHAASLAKVIQNLEGVEEISFVAHSMGNLVIRRYLAENPRVDVPSRPPPRLRRIVMIAPPNQGAELAERFRRSKVFKAVLGPSGTALAEQWDTIERQLAIPDCEFGIIAGGSGSDGGRNPLLEGDDDLVVSVAETRLAGARDFLVVPSLHSAIINNEEVQRSTLCFLKHGYFVAEEKRHPISSETERSESP